MTAATHTAMASKTQKEAQAGLKVRNPTCVDKEIEAYLLLQIAQISAKKINNRCRREQLQFARHWARTCQE